MWGPEDEVAKLVKGLQRCQGLKSLELEDDCPDDVVHKLDWGVLRLPTLAGSWSPVRLVSPNRLV